jgi:uncharacterized protein (TIGR03032 family)
MIESPAAVPDPVPLTSVHTNTFPQILQRLGISLLVTTYQAGRLVMLRADGDVLNTHFRSFAKPMGLAVQGARLAVGTAFEIWEFHQTPPGGLKLEPAGKIDACFLPRVVHFTADMQIHEMAWVGDELVFVNTLFSCLATRSPRYSFVPFWRPPFISALAPQDRCHLNGLGVRDGQVRYVTALGQTDTAAGWRPGKRDGGILMDVTSNEVLVHGLSMPHSPRWYDGKLWLLESGTGTLGYVDPATGRYRPIAEVPGFSRGLDFCGPIAFVGLSQVRETATFGGLPLTERLQERTCGVWAVNIHNGETIGWVKFTEGVQEIFAVQVLPGILYPELINNDFQLLSSSFVLPDEALNEVPETFRSSASS